MKQHPVPQNIASYQFHLVGEMTLKQFLELAGGLVAGWLIYSLHIAAIFKWPLVLLSGLSGIALAFLPIEERPLDRWVVNFLKAIYSPTQYIWKKNPIIPAIFQAKIPVVFLKASSANLIPKNKVELKEYLATLPVTPQKTDSLEEKRLLQLQQISGLLGITQPVSLGTDFPSTTQNFPLTPDVNSLKVRKLGPKTNIKLPQPIAAALEEKPPLLLKEEPVFAGPPIVEHAPPLSPPILVETDVVHKLDPALAAQFSTTLPIPSTPEVPNLVVGMILTDMEKIIPNAIIEIIDSQADTARALKSNKLGQFFCASPLKSGTYQIKVEHPEYQFDNIELKANNKIILPLKIKAKRRTQ